MYVGTSAGTHVVNINQGVNKAILKKKSLFQFRPSSLFVKLRLHDTCRFANMSQSFLKKNAFLRKSCNI